MHHSGPIPRRIAAPCMRHCITAWHRSPLYIPRSRRLSRRRASRPSARRRARPVPSAHPTVRALLPNVRLCSGAPPFTALLALGAATRAGAREGEARRREAEPWPPWRRVSRSRPALCLQQRPRSGTSHRHGPLPRQHRRAHNRHPLVITIALAPLLPYRRASQHGERVNMASIAAAPRHHLRLATAARAAATPAGRAPREPRRPPSRRAAGSAARPLRRWPPADRPRTRDRAPSPRTSTHPRPAASTG